MKVLIADDHAVVRRGIREILEEAPLGLTVDETASAGETLQAIGNRAYDIVLLDIHFPDGNGLDILQQIRAQQPQTRVLLFSMYPEEQYAWRALRLGAAGYLTKDSAASELLDAIRKVAAGGKYITQTLAEQLVDEIDADARQAPHEILSDREFQIMICLAEGKLVGEIAAELSLSSKTVSTYRARMLTKLHLRTAADIIRYALENRLIQ